MKTAYLEHMKDISSYSYWSKTRSKTEKELEEKKYFGSKRQTVDSNNRRYTSQQAEKQWKMLSQTSISRYASEEEKEKEKEKEKETLTLNTQMKVSTKDT